MISFDMEKYHKIQNKTKIKISRTPYFDGAYTHPLPYVSYEGVCKGRVNCDSLLSNSLNLSDLQGSK